MSEEKKTLIEFPCKFPLKIMGAKHPEFPAEVIKAVKVHAPDASEEHLQHRESSSGNYTGLTLPVNVENQEQLDNIYRALTSHPMVKVVL
ncbi:YbeD family protein [Neisseria sp. 83E34]|uniref:HP0495 family protein n=1 Tax=Neisseria sp. 83E34 TaxID=1692264 RepID=UPI0006CE7BF2|nr:DUF493 domain-containing protein [Neisseria sp. 83E34]KPN70971.1 hypothetical protein AKG09_08750 [Neisseria sp. 83E34]